MFLGVLAFAIWGVKLSYCCIVGVCALVLLAVLTPNEAVRYVEWSVTIAAAVRESKLADVVGDAIVQARISGFGLVLLLTTVTSIFANVITNRGAAQVMGPICVVVFKELKISPIVAGVIVSNAAVCGFLTPFGLSTSLLVQDPGKYTSKHCLLFGVPLTILYLLSLSVITSAVYNVW